MWPNTHTQARTYTYTYEHKPSHTLTQKHIHTHVAGLCPSSRDASSIVWCMWYVCVQVWVENKNTQNTQIILINKFSVNPKSTSNQSSKPCTVLQYCNTLQHTATHCNTLQCVQCYSTHQEKCGTFVCKCVRSCVIACVYMGGRAGILACDYEEKE